MHGVLGNRDVRLGIARATLRVNDLDVRGGSRAKADIHDVDDLVGLFGSLAFCDQTRSALATASRAVRTSEEMFVVLLATVARAVFTADWRITRSPARYPLS